MAAHFMAPKTSREAALSVETVEALESFRQGEIVRRGLNAVHTLSALKQQGTFPLYPSVWYISSF